MIKKDKINRLQMIALVFLINSDDEVFLCVELYELQCF